MKLSVSIGVALFAGTPLLAQAAQTGRVASPDPQEGEWFGSSVAISGDRMLVGVYFDDENGTAAGAVRVFERDAAGTWTHVARLTASDGSANDYFGGHVALDGDWALVCAGGDDVPIHNSGSVYAFQRQPDGSWLERQKIAPQLAGGSFGFSIDMQGRRALIGATNGGFLVGHAFVYERDASDQWRRVADLFAADPTGPNWFGVSVALDGDRALIGADADDELGFFAGAAYVFERDAGGQWRQRQKLHGSDSAAEDRFGFAVALDGDHALVGALEDASTVLHAGAVYAFELGASWVETQKLVPADVEAGDRFGNSLALDGRRAVVGDALDNFGPPLGAGQNAGSAYFYRRDASGIWLQTAKVYSDSPEREERLGYSVAMQDDEVAIGAIQENSAAPTSGAVFLFDAEPLSVDRTALGRSASGGRAWSRPPSQSFDLVAGPAFGGFAYKLLGSLSGTAPGIQLPGGLHLPLNPDGYFAYTLNPSGPPLAGSFGLLDAAGRARASLDLGRVPLSLIGRTFQHAFVVAAPSQTQALFVSNPQPLHVGP